MVIPWYLKPFHYNGIINASCLNKFLLTVTMWLNQYITIIRSVHVDYIQKFWCCFELRRWKRLLIPLQKLQITWAGTNSNTALNVQIISEIEINYLKMENLSRIAIHSFHLSNKYIGRYSTINILRMADRDTLCYNTKDWN